MYILDMYIYIYMYVYIYIYIYIFRYRWNNYKDNNRKSLRDEDHKMAGFFAHFQTAGHSGFINDTEIRFIDKTDPSDPTRREDFWIDTRYPQGLNNIDPYH